MDSLLIVSLERAEVAENLQKMLRVCILKEISFSVAYRDDQYTPKVIIYSSKSIINDLGDEVNPSINAIMLSGQPESFLNEKGSTECHNYHSVVGLLSREHQFLLPVIIDLLKYNINWRLRNVEGLIMSVERLEELHEKGVVDWAYISE